MQGKSGGQVVIDPIDQNRIFRKVHFQPVRAQEPSADQDFITGDKWCNGLNNTTIERKIDRIRVLFNPLTASEQRFVAAYKFRVQLVFELNW
jgi:hypothetical protein